jgi:hypothetical protein
VEGGIYLPPNFKINTNQAHRDNMIRKIIEILQTHDKDAEPYDLETKAKAATIGV